MENIKTTFAKNLQRIRKNNHLTQSKLAEMIKLDISTVQKWEYGDRWPRAEQFMQLCEVLNVSMSDLVDEQSKLQLSKESSLQEALAIISKALDIKIKFD